MRKLSGSSWGPSARDLRGVYIAFSRSKLEYAAAAWAPRLTATQKNKIEVMQNQAARVITGCVSSTKTESLLLEANLVPMLVRHNMLVAIVSERVRRLPDHDPLFQSSMTYVKKGRLTRRSKCWQGVSDQVLSSLNLNPERLSKSGKKRITKRERDDFRYDLRNREKLLFQDIEPWSTSRAHEVVFQLYVVGHCTKNSSENEKKIATDATIAALGQFDFEVWTDGSVREKAGAGAGLIFPKKTKYGNKSSKVIKVKAPAGYLCSSFRAEGIALKATLEKLVEMTTGAQYGANFKHSSVLIASDSQSLLSCLNQGPLRQNSEIGAGIWRSLLYLLEKSYCSKIVFQFVYSHCGVVKNEMVDRAADHALSSMESKHQQKAAIHMDAVKAELKSGLMEGWKSSLDQNTVRFRLGGKTSFSDHKMSATLTRRDETLLMQLRTGDCRLLGGFRHLLFKDRWDGCCRWCKCEKETVDHIFNRCLTLTSLRKEEGIADSEALFSKPKESVMFVHKALALLVNVS